MVGCLTIELVPVSVVLTDASREASAARAVRCGDGSIVDVTWVFDLGKNNVRPVDAGAPHILLGRCEGMMVTWLIHRRHLRHNPAQIGPLDLVW